MSLTPQALRLLSRELVTLRSDPPEGVRVVVDEDDISAVEGWVQGPAGTPYEGGYFRVTFEFGPEYPNQPPKCKMLTRIFHPNISKSGEICVDTLKKGWKKDYGVGHVLVTIKCLLIYPNPESALDEEAGKQLLADYEGYCKYAKLMTGIHATPKIAPAPFRTGTKATPEIVFPSPPAESVATTPSPMSASPQKPASRGPLMNARQETSPAPMSDAPAPLKTAPASAPTKAKAPTKAPAKTGAKRGLKRL